MFPKKALTIALISAAALTATTGAAQASPAITCTLQYGTAITAYPDPNSHIIWWASAGDQFTNFDDRWQGYDHATDIGTNAHRINVPGWFPAADLNNLCFP
ncbi:hypothetical protein [Amycolatopsis sp. NPDC004378]